MNEMANLVKLAVDSYKGSVEKFSVAEAQETLRQALIKMAGGSTQATYKAMRELQHNGGFAIVEEALLKTVVGGLQEDDFFMSMVDFRNVSLGDQNLFTVRDGSQLFHVAEVAEGTQGIRRQRLEGVTQTSIPTVLQVVKIYEEMNRILSGRADFNAAISSVGESFRRKLLDAIYAVWMAAGSAEFGSDRYFQAAGTYDEDTMLDIVAKTEAAANGAQGTILGTSKALRNLTPAIIGSEAKSDLYNLGYIGKFLGTPVVKVPNRFKIGTTDFVFDDNVITVLAGDDKPIKCVYEGDSLLSITDPLQQADLTQTYLYGDRYGLGIVVSGNSGIGRYILA